MNIVTFPKEQDNKETVAVKSPKLFTFCIAKETIQHPNSTFENNFNFLAAYNNYDLNSEEGKEKAQKQIIKSIYYN